MVKACLRHLKYTVTGEDLVREKLLGAVKKEWQNTVQATTTVLTVCWSCIINIRPASGTVLGSRPGCWAVMLEGMKAYDTTWHRSGVSGQEMRMKG